MELSPLANRHPEGNSLFLKLEELISYIRNNKAFIINYGDRYPNGVTISSAFVDINKRFGKR